MSANDIVASLSEVTTITLAALAKLGLDDHEQAIVSEVLLYAQKRGNSQGLIKIVERTILPDAHKKPIQIEQKSVCMASLNGHGNIGMVVLDKATAVAAQLVEDTGIALVASHNTRSSTGAIGYYAGKLAERGFIGLVLAGSPKVMAVEGGIDPIMGTNPVAIAIPSSSAPLVLDMATAAIAWFSVINARNLNQSLPAGVALDSDGHATTDPFTALNGVLKTFGGAKGAGLALMFEMLTGPLTGAAIAGDDEDNRGNLIIAIDPDMLTERNTFQHRVDQLIETIHHGRAGVRLPGQRSAELALQCEQRDEISIDADLLRALRAIVD